MGYGHQMEMLEKKLMRQFIACAGAAAMAHCKEHMSRSQSVCWASPGWGSAPAGLRSGHC
jgi:hypothetical protein